jgi:hypothetical protein
MTRKRFDCVEMKRKAAAPINERLQGMTVEQQIAYWQERSEAFAREYGEGTPVQSPAPSPARVTSG